TPPSTPSTYPLSLHDALPISDGGRRNRSGRRPRGRRRGGGGASGECGGADRWRRGPAGPADRRGHGVDAGAGRGGIGATDRSVRSEEHTSELQSREKLVCRLL